MDPYQITKLAPKEKARKMMQHYVINHNHNEGEYGPYYTTFNRQLVTKQHINVRSILHLGIISRVSVAIYLMGYLVRFL